jgi:chromosome segregation ATPase
MYHENEREIAFMQKEYISYDLRMKALSAHNRELQEQVQDLRDVNYEQENMHIFEEKQMRVKHAEIVDALNYDIQMLQDEKQYLEEQKESLGKELKDLFTTNGELEKQLGDKGLEIENLKEQLKVNQMREDVENAQQIAEAKKLIA